VNESKIELTHRLQHEGRWSEASLFKDQTIKQLRSEGKTRSEAQEAAWEAMETQFPPLAPPDEPEPELTFSEQFDDMPASTPEAYFRDATWVYERLAVAGVKPGDAPSPGAWALLQWAKGNQDRFFEQIMPKAFAAKQKAVESPITNDWDGCDDLSELEDLIADTRNRVDEQIRGNIPDFVSEKVRTIVADIHERIDPNLTSEGIHSLSARMISLVDEVVQAAIKDPAPFQKNPE